VLCGMYRWREAEVISQRALRLVPTDLNARYLLAICQIGLHQDTAEALRNLEMSAAKYPKARIVAYNLLLRAGRRGEATVQLEEFLRSVPEDYEYRKKAEETLARLRK